MSVQTSEKNFIQVSIHVSEGPNFDWTNFLTWYQFCSRTFSIFPPACWPAIRSEWLQWPWLVTAIQQSGVWTVAQRQPPHWQTKDRVGPMCLLFKIFRHEGTIGNMFARKSHQELWWQWCQMGHCSFLMTTWQCLEMMAPSDTGVTMDAWHGFLDGGWNCKSFQSNAGFWCFFGGLEILFFPIKYLSGWQPLSLPLETCHLGGEDPMEAVTDPTAETETSSLPSDDTAVADRGQDDCDSDNPSAQTPQSVLQL